MSRLYVCADDLFCCAVDDMEVAPGSHQPTETIQQPVMIYSSYADRPSQELS